MLFVYLGQPSHGASDGIHREHLSQFPDAVPKLFADDHGADLRSEPYADCGVDYGSANRRDGVTFNSDAASRSFWEHSLDRRRKCGCRLVSSNFCHERKHAYDCGDAGCCVWLTNSHCAIQRDRILVKREFRAHILASHAPYSKN